MQNDPELQLQARFLGTLTQDFATISETLHEAAYHIRIRKISDFPIFPVCKIEQSIGQLLVNKKEIDLQWHFYASFVEEFVQRELMDASGLEVFKTAYKNPDEFCCLFVIDEEFTNFVFIPYPID